MLQYKRMISRGKTVDNCQMKCGDILRTGKLFYNVTLTGYHRYRNDVPLLASNFGEIGARAQCHNSKSKGSDVIQAADRITSTFRLPQKHGAIPCMGRYNAMYE